MMVYFRWLMVTLLLSVAVVAFAGGDPENYDVYLDSLYRDTVPTVEPEAASERIADNPNTLLLDVRSEPERSVSFIDGSEFADFETFSIEKYLSLPRDTPILAYCAVGYRSERVGEEFIAAGFVNVSHVYGGIIEWHNRGLSLMPGPAAQTETTNTSPTDDTAPEEPVVHGNLPRWGKWVTDGRVTYDPPTQ